MLFNASHHERRPRGARAAFRLLGAFTDAGAARAHAASLPADCDLLVASLGRGFALTRALPADEGAHLARLLDAHTRRLRDHEREFLGNVAEHKAGATTTTPNQVCSEDVVDGGGGEEGERQPAKIPRDAELRCQNFAVLSVVHDSDEPVADRQEPAVVVWGVYDTEDSAKDAIKKRLSLSVKDLHLEVCSMYEWLEPTEVSKHLDDIAEEFRDETLTSIIAQRKTERLAVKAFRDLCGDDGAPMVDLSRPEPQRLGFDKAVNLSELSAGSLLVPRVQELAPPSCGVESVGLTE